MDNVTSGSTQTETDTTVQSSAVVNNGETLDIATGVSFSSVAVNTGGLVSVSGTLSGVTVSGGEVDVFSGGVVSAASLTNGG
ncbi:hypothetical protein, partial [Acetobacter cibinongensis]|uniref:hypothetical protein n=1 Tax=Acetobacter cibinongensis TaxID=146475 RepID=UPI001056C99D